MPRLSALRRRRARWDYQAHRAERLADRLEQLVARQDVLVKRLEQHAKREVGHNAS